MKESDALHDALLEIKQTVEMYEVTTKAQIKKLEEEKSALQRELQRVMQENVQMQKSIGQGQSQQQQDQLTRVGQADQASVVPEFSELLHDAPTAGVAAASRRASPESGVR
jgi:uncharacterized protein (UPF0335 family)